MDLRRDAEIILMGLRVVILQAIKNLIVGALYAPDNRQS